MKIDLIVIGGGAAGLFAGATAAQQGKQVMVLEKMDRPARKLMITGKGRCNLTNDCSREEFFSSIKTGSKFLYSAYSSLCPQDVMALFEKLGVPLKVERGGRVFPVSDKAVDIVDALVRYTKASGARIVFEKAKSLIIENGRAVGVITESRQRYFAQDILIATGGKSYPLTGSTGDGYILAEQAGHTINKLRPSLIPIVTQENWCRDAMGLSLKNVVLKLYNAKNKVIFSDIGEMLFTHFGISGPLVLSASAQMAGDISDYRLEIDLKPGLDYNQLDTRLLRDFLESSNKDYINSLGALLPRKLIAVVVNLSGIDPQQKVNQITKEERQRLAKIIKALTLTPKSFRPIEEAVVTSGGIKLSEVDPKTMRSKLVEGLLFAGEILDIDGYTGGYNLQIAFCTGHQAACAVCAK